MRIAESFKAAFHVTAAKVCDDVAAALKATNVSKVKVENLTGATGRLKAKVTFFYAEARVSAWLDQYTISLLQLTCARAGGG